MCIDFLEVKQKMGTIKNIILSPQSLNLNSIKLLWEEPDRRVRDRCPTSKTHLWSILQDSWKNVSADTLQKLICLLQLKN